MFADNLGVTVGFCLAQTAEDPVERELQTHLRRPQALLKGLENLGLSNSKLQASWRLTLHADWGRKHFKSLLADTCKDVLHTSSRTQSQGRKASEITWYVLEDTSQNMRILGV